MKHLTFSERKKIEYLLNVAHGGKREIGRMLKRSHSTIVEEINKNTKYGQKYDAEEAQIRAMKNQAKKGNKSKIENNLFLREYIIRKLTKEQWSPEQISARLKGRFYDEQIGDSVSHETIYQFIYAEENKYLKLFKYLRRSRSKRIQHGKRRNRKENIQQMTSIHQRPEIINKRKRFGDWENDSMIFSQQQDRLNVTLERQSRLVRICVCKDKSAEETNRALRDIIYEFEEECRSVTFDRGSENAYHWGIKEEYGIKTYFCDPYSSWQKGAVENINMFLRQYLPRNIKLNKLTDDEIYQIQEKLNNRPRKCLGWFTPNEYVEIQLSNNLSI